MSKYQLIVEFIQKHGVSVSQRFTPSGEEVWNITFWHEPHQKSYNFKGSKFESTMLEAIKETA